MIVKTNNCNLTPVEDKYHLPIKSWCKISRKMIITKTSAAVCIRSMTFLIQFISDNKEIVVVRAAKSLQ